MGNKLSTREKRVLLVSTGVLSTIILIKTAKYFFQKSESRAVKNLLKNGESLQDILLNKQITSKDRIQFQKEEPYHTSILKIQQIQKRIHHFEKQNSRPDEILSAKKQVIQLIHTETWNLWITCNLQVFELNRRKRRMKIDSLVEYIDAVLAEARQDETILFLCKKEVLSDAKIAPNKYEKDFQSLFEIIPSFFIELEVTSEFEKVLRRPYRKSELSLNDIEDFYKKSLSILKEAETRNTFAPFAHKIASGSLSLIVQNYIDDRIAISSGIEKEDIIKRREFLKNASVQKLKSKYTDLFLNLFPE